jgi:hypothetical protein
MTGRKITEDLAIAGQYEVAVLEAQRVYDIMTRDPWYHYMACKLATHNAKVAYEKAKKEADETYLATRTHLYRILVKELGHHEAERTEDSVKRHGTPDGKPLSSG